MENIEDIAIEKVLEKNFRFKSLQDVLDALNGLIRLYTGDYEESLVRSPKEKDLGQLLINAIREIAVEEDEVD